MNHLIVIVICLANRKQIISLKVIIRTYFVAIRIVMKPNKKISTGKCAVT